LVDEQNSNLNTAISTSSSNIIVLILAVVLNQTWKCGSYSISSICDKSQTCQFGKL